MAVVGRVSVALPITHQWYCMCLYRIHAWQPVLLQGCALVCCHGYSSIPWLCENVGSYICESLW